MNNLGPVKKKKVKKFILAFLMFVFLFSIIAIFWWYKLEITTPNSNLSSTKSFKIEKGEGASEIALRLQKERLIRNRYVFLSYLALKRLNPKIQAGEYDIPQNLNIKELSQLLVSGKTRLYRLTIPEGWDLQKIAERVEKEYQISKEDFFTSANFKNYEVPDYFSGISREDSMEGFLYPATYDLPANPSADDIVSRMFEAFKKKYSYSFEQQAKLRGLTTYEVVTLASMVEREVSSLEDRKLVASVFLNRLKIGMPLESCATIQYITKTNKTQFTFEETRIPSPYNTYLNKGLPRGPIGNPSIESIKAVLWPIESDYYYFLSADGKTYFSKTFEEHNLKKAKYLD